MVARPADEAPGARGMQPGAVQSAAAMLAAAGAQTATVAIESRNTAAMVIYNAAMLPGWPYPSAFARDSAAQPRAALATVAAPLAHMSPEEMADYLARMGAQARLLKRLRHALKKLEGLETAAARGFLAAFLSAVETLMNGLAVAAEEHAQRIALRADLPDGDDPDGTSPTRRRLRL